MKKLKDAIKEAAEVSVTDFVSSVAKEIKKIFPKSFVQVTASRLGSGIIIRFAIGKDKSEWANGIIQNDPLHTIFFIDGFDKDSNTTDKMELSGERSDILSLHTVDGNRIKIPFRKVKGNSIKMLAGVKKQFTKIKDVVKSNLNNLKDKDMIKGKL